MRTIGRIGVRAALLVGFTLALGTPAAHAQGLPPTGVGPVDDVVDDVGDLLPEPPPVALPAAPEAPPLPVPDPSGAVPGLPAPPSGAPGSPPVAAPDLGGLPAPGGLPGPDAPADLGAIPDPGGLPTLCGLGSGVPDADVVDCVLTTLLGGDAPGILEPPDAVCDLNGTLGGILDPVCRDDPGTPAVRRTPAAAAAPTATATATATLIRRPRSTARCSPEPVSVRWPVSSACPWPPVAGSSSGSAASSGPPDPQQVEPARRGPALPPGQSGQAAPFRPAPCGFDDVEPPSGSPTCHPCPVRQFAGEGARDAMMW